MKLFREAFRIIQKNKTTAAMTAAILVCNLIILAIFGHMIRNLNRFLNEVNSSVQVAAYTSDKMKIEDINLIVARIKAQEGVKDCVYIPKEEAIKEFSEDPDLKNYIETIKENPLPNTVKIEVHERHRNPAGLQAIADFVGALPGIVEVNYRKEETDRYFSIISTIKLFAAGIAAILVISSAFIIASTVRMNILSRKHEINAMLKQGTHHSAIRNVFVLESVLISCAAGIIASILLVGLELSVINKINILWSGKWLRVDALFSFVMVMFSSILGLLSSVFIRIQK